MLLHHCLLALMVASAPAADDSSLEFELNNGNKFPAVGLGIGNMQRDRIPSVLGTAMLQHGVRAALTLVCLDAIDATPSAQVQLVDTAMASNTDAALRDTRGLQVVTKVWYTHLGYGRTKLAVEEMLDGLNGCCSVTMLIHWPRCRDDISWMHCEDEEANLPQRVKDAGPAPAEDAWKGSWTALEEFYADGKLKNIGVSNFELDDLNELLSSCKVVPQLYQGNAWQLWFRPEVLQRLSEKNVLYQACLLYTSPSPRD